MSEPSVSCSTCGRGFVPRFTFQTVKAGDGRVLSHFCSQTCRYPELGGRKDQKSAAAPSPNPPAPAAASERRAPPRVVAHAQHECHACHQHFTLQFAFQVVSLGESRHVVCSEACKDTLLAPMRAEQAARNRSPRAIAVMNQKGGTAKTTTSVSIAAGLAERGYSTLLVDLDAQGSVGVSLGVNGSKTLYHVLVDGVTPEDAAVPVRGNLEVLTADQTMAAAEIELVNMKDRARVLTRRMAHLLAPTSPYDYIIMDCAPSLSLLNQNALTFAREVVVPVSCDYLSLVGVKQILRTLRHVNEVLLHPVEVLGVLPTFYDVRNRISKEAVKALTDYFKDRVLPPIRVNARLKEAPSHKKTIFEYAPESHGAADYYAVVDALIKRRPVATAPVTSTTSRALGAATRTRAHG